MKVFVNAFWLTSCRITADLLSFVLFAAIARDFGPAGTGEYSYGFAVGTLVALVSTCGFEDFGIRAYASATTPIRPQLWADMLATQYVQLGIGILVFVVFLLVGALHARNLIVLTELGIYVVCWWLSRTFFIPAMAAQSMKAPAITELACRFAAIRLRPVARRSHSRQSAADARRLSARRGGALAAGASQCPTTRRASASLAEAGAERSTPYAARCRSPDRIFLTSSTRERTCY